MKPALRRSTKKQSLKYSLLVLSLLFAASVVASLIACVITSVLTSIAISHVICYFETFKQCVIKINFDIIYSDLLALYLLIVLTTAGLCRIGYLFTLHMECMRDKIYD